MRRLIGKAEELIYDGIITIGTPLLILWVTYGLRREDLTEELVEFWNEYNHV